MKSLDQYIKQAEGPYNSYWVYNPMTRKAYLICAAAQQLINRGLIVLCTGTEAMALVNVVK